jgi:CHAT domain-containing protein/Tfp pilus assembly protein PilF
MPCCYRWLIAWVMVLGTALANAQMRPDWLTNMKGGQRERELGFVHHAIDHFRQARVAASNDRERMQATAELGAMLLQARRLDQADSMLREALALATLVERAGIELDLGNLAILRKDPATAREHFAAVEQLSAAPSNLTMAARLNSVRLAPVEDQRLLLARLYDEMVNHAQTKSDARLYLNLGHQATVLGKPAMELAYLSLERARTLSETSPSARLHMESLDALAQLYENQGLHADALRLSRKGLDLLHVVSRSLTGDLAIALEWRVGRLEHVLGNEPASLAAYRRAVNQVELIRQDIPIDYDDGQSSFHATFEPLYMGLAERLMATADGQSPDQREGLLRSARDAVELIKQSELQDYLGDRCAVDAVKGGSASVILPGTAVLYPLVFSDRIELLLETDSQMLRFTTAVAGQLVRAAANELAREIRIEGGDYLAPAQRLHAWLLGPIDSFLQAQAINTLVVVPDASLRVVPLAALHDGNHYAIEKYAIATATGMSMTNTTPPPRSRISALVAGASSFGQVVDKYGGTRLASLLEVDPGRSVSAKTAPNRMLRSARASIQSSNRAPSSAPSRTRAERIDFLRQALALPGVSREIQSLGHMLPGTTLADSDFTVDAFRVAATSDQYGILHVASHGIFGGSADNSYIVAYDDLLTLDGLQSMLKDHKFQKHPIELLTLSACETAAGDDRAPLGISGAAMKARAKSVLGTLWPVDDEAAVLMMSQFYAEWSSQRLTKAQALQRAQRQLINNQRLADPYFWAPFVLIGNWL